MKLNKYTFLRLDSLWSRTLWGIQKSSTVDHHPPGPDTGGATDGDAEAKESAGNCSWT